MIASPVQRLAQSVEMPWWSDGPRSQRAMVDRFSGAARSQNARIREEWMPPNYRLLSDAYATALLRRASFSAPKPGRYAASHGSTETAFGFDRRGS